MGSDIRKHSLFGDCSTLASCKRYVHVHSSNNNSRAP
jgi:hypothetical protein